MTLGLRILLMMELIIRVINFSSQPTMEYWIDPKTANGFTSTLVLYGGKSNE
jgi:hypothetical protein